MADEKKELEAAKAESAGLKKQLAELAKLVEGLQAKVDRREKDLAVSRRSAEAMALGLKGRIEHGATPKAIRNHELRLELQAAARKVMVKNGKGEKEQCAQFRIVGDPHITTAGFRYPEGSIVDLPMSQLPSIYWTPIGAMKVDGHWRPAPEGFDPGDEGPQVDDGDADADQVSRALGGTPSPASGPAAPKRPSDTSPV